MMVPIEVSPGPDAVSVGSPELGSGPSPSRGRVVSPRQMEALRTFAEMGDQRSAARQMGVSVQTLKNHLRWAYHALGVHSAIDAFRVLGWLRVP